MDRNRSKQIKPSRATRTVAATLLLLAVTLSSCTKEPTGGELPSPDGQSIAVHITFPKSEQPQAANAVAKGNTFATKASASGNALSNSSSNISSNASGDSEGLTFWTSDTPNVATRADAGTAEEQQIDHMTIFVFNTDGTTLENVLDIDLTSANTSLPDQQPQWKDNKTLMVRPITDKKSPKKIYAVANWNETNFDKATYTEAMLRDALSTITKVEQLATPLLMSGSSSVNLSTSDSKVTIALERQVAKLNINLTVDAATQAALANIEWLTNEAQIMVGNIPDKSYVVGRTPAAFPADYTLLASGFMPMTVVSASGDLKWNSGIYVHENPLTGTDVGNKGKTNYIVINLPYRNKNTGVEEPNNYYKVYLDNTGDANPYQVLRNTIYNSNLKVVGLGQPFPDFIPDVNIEEDMIVNPWEDFDFGGDSEPRYFSISDNCVWFQFEETAHKVTISTDVNNWKLTKTDGTTLFSFAENKTDPFTDANLTYTIGGTASLATITVTRNSTETFAPQKMTLAARNIRVPFTVNDNSNDDNGFIPNSVLVKSFVANIAFYAGWSDSLPKRGLQIAKRGNVLPSGTALSDDLLVQWSTKEHDITGTESGCGFGKHNTELILERDAATIENHPAVNKCKALGDGWYLPSRDELLLIYANKSLLGSSYSFSANTYWSTAQTNPYYAWTVFFKNGSIKKSYYNNELRVRCVRNI